MEIRLNKMTLKGHSSFYLRDGWLNKLFLLNDVEFLRNQQEASDILGIGSAMVKAVKFYLNAMDLINLAKGKEIRSDLFFAIQKFDPYLEEDFTKYILHYKLISNADKATTWHTFFNYINYDELTKEEAFSRITDIYSEAFPEQKYSMKSISDDIDCLVNNYAKKDEKGLTPEDRLQSPLSELGLIEFDGKKIIRTVPPIERISARLALYIILSEVEKLEEKLIDNRYNIAIDEIINDTNNVGKILNLSRTEIYGFMNELATFKNIEFHKTAGLDQLYISSQYKSLNVFNDYFEEQ